MVDLFGVLLSRFRFALGEFRDPAGAVPIGNEDVRIGIDEAAVRCAERARLDAARIEVVIRPLRLLRIVAQKSNRHVVSIEDGNAPFQFRHHRVITFETDLAGRAQVLGHRADVFAIKVEVAQAPVFPIAYQQQRLLVTQVEGKAMRTVELPFTVSFLRKASPFWSKRKMRESP